MTGSGEKGKEGGGRREENWVRGHTEPHCRSAEADPAKVGSFEIESDRHKQ